MGLASVMSTMPGRVVRIAVGIAMLAIGAALGGGWWVLAVAGLLPISAGVMNVCLIAPLIRAPLSGADARRAA
jgi:hypothetical protein